MNEDSHDKVWGVIYLKNPYNTGVHIYDRKWPLFEDCVVFWGRRGKKLQMQKKHDDHELYKKIEEKIKKGYKEVDESKLYEVYPNFKEDLEMLAVMAALKF